MKTKTMVLAAAALTFSAVALTAGPASARIVCNSYGDCWHTDNKYNYSRYDRDFRPRYYNDDFYFHRRWNDTDAEYRWRDHHEGRGYYKNGIWLTF